MLPHVEKIPLLAAVRALPAHLKLLCWISISRKFPIPADRAITMRLCRLCGPQTPMPECAATAGFSLSPMASAVTICGEVASREAVETMLTGFRKAPGGEPLSGLLTRLVQAANIRVYEAGRAASPVEFHGDHGRRLRPTI